MPICPYCHSSAGMFRQTHAQCERDYALGVEGLPVAIRDSLVKGESPQQMLTAVKWIAGNSRLAREDVDRLCLQGWNATLDAYLSDGILSDYEQTRLQEAARLLELKEADMIRESIPSKIAMARALAAILAGQATPHAMTRYGYDIPHLPFLLQSTETLVWAFPSTLYYEEKTRRHRVSQSQGVSMRVAKGLYVRTGSSQGYTVEETGMEYQDVGVLAITTKHIIFAGDSKSVRIPYKKIVVIQPYTDGFGIMRDTATARLQNFVTQRGWFSYNLVRHIAAESL